MHVLNNDICCIPLTLPFIIRSSSSAWAVETDHKNRLILQTFIIKIVFYFHLGKYIFLVIKGINWLPLYIEKYMALRNIAYDSYIVVSLSYINIFSNLILSTCLKL